MKNYFSPISRRKFIKSVSLLFLGGLLPIVRKTGLFPGSDISSLKQIYIAPDDHTDYFWSAGESGYQQAFLNMLDYYLTLADTTANNPSTYQSRWTCDGSFWLWIYEKNRPAADFNRLINRIKDGHISVPLNALILADGGAPTEGILRGMYYPGKIERKYNLRFNLAIPMENQTLSFGLGSLLVGAGAKYCWKGICGCDSQVSNAGDREHDIYWWSGADGSRILMKWNSMLVYNQAMGGYSEARIPSNIIEYVDTDPQFIARYPYQVIGAFGKGWDDLQTLTAEFITTAQTKSNASRQVIVSNEVDFFQNFEAMYGASLPSVSASFGNEWDLYCAALAEVSASVKRSVEKLRSAEAMATLVSLKNASFMDERTTARDQAWMDLGLYWEHNIGMVASPLNLVDERIAWQRRLAEEIKSYVDSLHSDSVAALGGMILKVGSNLRFFVFNSLSWMRTDVADFPYSGLTPVKVIDLSSNTETPSQIVTIDGVRYLRVYAQEVPSVGYKVFEIQTGNPGSFSNDAPWVNGNILNNSQYQVSLAANGAITSLIDKTKGNREFSKNIGGYYMNDLGGEGVGSPQAENVGPVSVTMLCSANSPLIRTTRVTLFRNSNRIDIRNDINQNFDAVYKWKFGFNLTVPDVWHEEVGAVIRAKLTTQGGHYSSRAGNSRYDWLTINHFADISDALTGVTLSNADCFFMQLGNSTVNTLDTNTPQLSPLIGGKVVNGDNGLPGQGGDSHFMQRFSLQTHDAFSATAAMRFALEHQNPFVTGQVTGGSLYPEAAFSLLSISNPDVLMWVLKPADDSVNQEIITRVWNLSPNPANFVLSMTPGPIKRAQNTTHIETIIGTANLTNGNLAESINQRQIKSYSLSLNDWKNHKFLPLVKKTSSTSSFLKRKFSKRCKIGRNVKINKFR
jgi:alpha-mannosidase